MVLGEIMEKKQCVHTELTVVSVKARCLIQVVSEASGDFSCKLPYNMALVKCSCAFRLRRLAQNDVHGGVRGHFSG